MKNIAIINGISLSRYALTPLVNNKNSLQRVFDFSKTLPKTEKTVLLSSEAREKADGVEIIIQEKWSMKDLLEKMADMSAEYDNIFYYYGDCPFLDPALARKMFENHIKYMADYTFADGYPYGLTPEIIKSDIVKRLILLNKDDNTEGIRVGGIQAGNNRQGIFGIIKQDINSFDIETELAPSDQRLLRVQLCADTKRNLLLVKRIMEKAGKDTPLPDSAEICRILDAEPEILRTLPSYFSIQITEQCPQACSYCPYPQFGGNILEKKREMEPEKLKLILEKIADFCDDAVISISLWGDPVLHSRFGEIVELLCAHRGFSIIIETAGINANQDSLNRDMVQRLASLENPPVWILSLDAWTHPVYESIRGKGFAKAYETAELLLSLAKDRVYFQAVRMKENEDDLEHFYLNWQKKTDKIIIQKYDDFCGILPERKVTDLSPLKRFPCWHLKRDMVVLPDGAVPLCREDVRAGIVLGNIFTDDISALWENGQQYYLRHISQEYPELCRKCDEYYTFNF